jgi:hypothetical protein
LGLINSNILFGPSNIPSLSLRVGFFANAYACAHDQSYLAGTAKFSVDSLSAVSEKIIQIMQQCLRRSLVSAAAFFTQDQVSSLFLLDHVAYFDFLLNSLPILSEP